jgi:S-DNA-T family DNA segregation ATPase FtsK/SpoIIIE
MPKKKKNTRRASKDLKSGSLTNSPFWSYAAAVVLIVAAIFVFLGGFGAGGILPVDLFKGSFWVIGWTAYLLPIALVYFAVYKFKTEDHRIPLAKLTSMILVLAFISSFVFISLATKNTHGTLAGDYGGKVGSVTALASLHVLNRLAAGIFFLVVALMSIFYAFSISPSVLGKLGSIFRKKETDEDSELEKLKAGADQSDFTLTEGVPVEHHGPKPEANTARHSPLREAAQKVSGNDTHALTAPSDPTWQFPSLKLLNQTQDKADPGDVKANAKIIHDTFANFKIDVEMEGANIGPRVTQFSLKPPADVKLTKLTALENNLALDLAAHSIRMEAPIPGKRAVGVEVPNVKAATVRISSLVASKEWADFDGPLALTIGKDIAGKPVLADLSKMPHMLIAGQTGSGKSVMINTLISSLLYRNSPSDLKLILVDPKQVEMGAYNDLPHLLSPVITEPEKCISALKWAVAEMDRRLKAMSEVGRRNIQEYNTLKESEGMPYIVIVIDELADLMMIASRDVETLIVRLAQKARSAGIHLILATQRPSVDVITGLIKANIPARVAFTTASQVDSRTIIDQIGAEKLLGSGDMLLLTSEMPKPKRVQAAYIESAETHRLNDFIRAQRPPQYDDEVVSQPVQLSGGRGNILSDMGSGESDDNLWRDAVALVIENRKASTSLLQRKLRIGYGRAARLIESMEEQGIIGSADGSRPREVLVTSVDEVFGGSMIEEEQPMPESEPLPEEAPLPEPEDE